MTTKKLIQIHILQNYSPANLNRDDTGSPKDSMFGGVLRGRISSQCLKRAMRKSVFFEDAFQTEGLLANRTRQLYKLLAAELNVLKASEAEKDAILARIPEMGKKAKDGGESVTDDASSDEGDGTANTYETKQLIHIAPNEVKPMADKLLTMYRQVGAGKWAKYDMKEIRKNLGKSLPRSVDISLWGRMTTDEAFEDVHAAAQVAHALSTNVVKQDFDYYTAVDDLSGETGAGMIGDVEFNSSTYYKYMNVNFDKLASNLGGSDAVTVAARAVMAVMDAAVFAQPSGKQNSFAAYNLPDFVLLEVCPRILPVNYANAFLQPARPKDGKTLMEVSIEQLAGHVLQMSKLYSLKAERAFLTTQANNKLGDWQTKATLEDLKTWLGQQLEQ
ncbi:MAG: type I-E CRISPR-associated protein Cas7/Cse4/CasC [Anaerolineae bacterium]|nr:type I-E CRISPR-associated protein Cas7/Cse4/CasC [Anaerolineae bacterium]